MPFVHRDAEGTILAVYEEHLEGTEEVDPHDPALTDFFHRNLPAIGNLLENEWVLSDLALARVLEDLIEILMDKKTIMFTDFPEGAQQKLRERRGLRKEVTYVEDLFVSDDDFDEGEGGLL
ncbi:MAG: hypothetical protein HOH04_15465 [Rhodospirillaceae bacterium]|jgi:hypothetical protein|nr:hypothetical protein [Rhodospirillaceae bacterium]